MANKRSRWGYRDPQTGQIFVVRTKDTAIALANYNDTESFRAEWRGPEVGWGEWTRMTSC